MTTHTTANRAPSLLRRTVVLWLIMAIALAAFESFSGSSSYHALMSILGVRLWALTLAWAFIAMDFAGLARLVMPDLKVWDESWKYFLAGAWLLSAVFDTWLTYFAVKLAIAGQTIPVLVTSGAISMEEYTTGAPAFIAVLSWAVQVGLVGWMNLNAARAAR
jgi:hypothetical protein